MTYDLPGAAPAVVAVLERVVAAAQRDHRVLGVVLAGSGATGQMDEFSDLDLVLVSTAEHHAELLREARTFVSGLGDVVAAFTGEHVGEPRLLVVLLRVDGATPVKLDLKIVAEPDLDVRVEDGMTVWQRGDAVSRALARRPSSWPEPDPQWLEDRFWVWVYYGATKIGRGELFAALNTLAELNQLVIGPLVAHGRGHRASGVRRLETIAPDLAEQLTATVATYDAGDCLRALRATADCYRLVRDSAAVQVNAAAEATSMAYLDHLGEVLAIR